MMTTNGGESLTGPAENEPPRTGLEAETRLFEGEAVTSSTLDGLLWGLGLLAGEGDWLLW